MNNAFKLTWRSILLVILLSILFMIGSAPLLASASSADTSKKVSVYAIDKVYVNNWGGKKKTLLKTINYNEDGLITKINEKVVGQYYKYSYDNKGRIAIAVEGDGSSSSFIHNYKYDNNGHLTEIKSSSL